VISPVELKTELTDNNVDMEYHLIDAKPSDAQWVNELTINTMRPWVEASWKEESYRQHYYDLNSFDLETTKIIIVGTKRAGRISCEKNEKNLTLADLHLIPDFHGSGLGTKIIKDTINEAFSKGLGVELKCLRTNPVQGLYLRLGFKLIDQDEKRLYYRLECNKRTKR